MFLAYGPLSGGSYEKKEDDAMKKRILNSEVIFGVLASIVAIYFIVASQPLPGATKNGVPGSGYFPTIAACGVLFFSVLLIIQGFRSPKTYFHMEKSQLINLVQMVEVLLALAGFLIIWKFIPFIPAALIYVFALSLILKQPLKFSIPYTIGVVVVLYLIFSVAFKVKLNIN
jgi:hypothetical protein